MRERLCRRVNGCVDMEGGKRLCWAGEVNEDPALRGSKRKLGAEGSSGIAAVINLCARLLGSGAPFFRAAHPA